ncbi:hypothetical protein PAEN110709_16170 [Paenibacillus endophyticus]
MTVEFLGFSPPCTIRYLENSRTRPSNYTTLLVIFGIYLHLLKDSNIVVADYVKSV